MNSFQRDIETALPAILSLPGPRPLIALAGPPGAGKSTFAEGLRLALEGEGHRPAVVPMDGYHLDNRILSEQGLLHRKGAPNTFDGDGFCSLVRRIAHGGHVYYPLFDRDRDISIAGAGELAPETSHVIFEGNYLLCDVPPWSGLLDVWSFTIRVDPGMDTIARRLLSRWTDQGLPEPEARRRRDENDLPNARFVAEQSVAADLILGASL